jgi:hypothetical protein
VIRALVTKELRETWAYAALALALSLAFVCRQTGFWSRSLLWLLDWVPGLAERALLPFIQSGFGGNLGLIGFVLALTLGFRQSCWEPSRGTTLYLLHLPVRRNTYFVTKLSTGMGLLLGCMSLPILVYAGWAAWPGTHPAPFEWTMIGLAVRVWLLMPLLYLGAFASGIRPARWVGSRLLPLVAVAVPAVVIYNTSWLPALAAWGLLSAAFVSNILFEAATRDF